MSTVMLPDGGSGQTSKRTRTRTPPRTHLQPRGSGNAIQQQAPERKRARKDTTTRPSGATSGGSTGGTSGGGGGGGFSAPSTSTTSDQRQRQQEAEQRQREAEEERKRKEQERQQQLETLRDSIRETPLDPNLVAQFAARERASKRAVEEAEVSAQRGREQSRVDFDQFLRQLDQQTGQAMGGLRGEAAARNLAFQPAFVGVGMRDIRDQAAESQASAQQQRAEFLAGIERQIDQAQQASQSEQAAIERERARAQADHRNWVQTQLAALE